MSDSSLENKVAAIEAAQKEYCKSLHEIKTDRIRDREDMDHMIVKLNQIHYSLIGTDYQKNGGGLVQQFDKTKKDVDDLKKWKIKQVTIRATLTGLFGLVTTFSLIRWQQIINLVKEILPE